MVLQHHGMDPKKDVTFMTIGGAETSIVAMRNGIIHARAFNPDAAYIMKKQGFTELGVLADMGPGLGRVIRLPTRIWQTGATSSNAGPAPW